ncbi:MAG: TolC family protein [Gemmatimonadota bacterium]
MKAARRASGRVRRGRVAGLVLLAAVLAGPGARGAFGQEERTLAPGGGLTLEEALRTALARNPGLESADAAAAAASSARWADWGAFLPVVGASASLSQTDFTNVTFLTPEGSPATIDPPLEDVSKSSSASLSFGFSLLNPERIADVKAGAAREEAAWLRLTSAERTVIRDVKRSYFEALKQQRLLAAAEAQLEARRVDLEMTRERYRIAAASRSDLLGAEIDAGDAELRVLSARDALEAAVRSLQVVAGTEVTAVRAEDVRLRDVEALPAIAGLDAAALVQAARGSSPALRALALDEKAASASLWSARAAWLPTIDLRYSLGRGKQLGRDESLFDFDPANTSTSFQVIGSWNLFQGFTRKRQTSEASRQLRQARADLTAQSLQLEKEVRDLAGELERRGRRLELLGRTRELAAERLDLARELYRLGSIQYFNLQQAIDRLTQAEQSLFTERYDYLIRWAELEQRVGPGLAAAAARAPGWAPAGSPDVR